jgi:hypothetical protein
LSRGLGDVYKRQAPASKHKTPPRQAGKLDSGKHFFRFTVCYTDKGLVAHKVMYGYCALGLNQNAQ